MTALIVATFAMYFIRQNRWTHYGREWV